MCSSVNRWYGHVEGQRIDGLCAGRSYKTEGKRRRTQNKNTTGSLPTHCSSSSSPLRLPLPSSSPPLGVRASNSLGLDGHRTIRRVSTTRGHSDISISRLKRAVGADVVPLVGDCRRSRAPVSQKHLGLRLCLRIRTPHAVVMSRGLRSTSFVGSDCQGIPLSKIVPSLSV